MAVLVRITAALVCGACACYSPKVEDCTVSCDQAGDCAHGQMCGEDHFCAAPAMAGRCMTRLVPDAAPIDAPVDAAVVVHDAPAVVADARTPDAAPPPDAPPATLSLHVQISGKGLVQDGPFTCDSMGAQHGNCMFGMQAGMPVTLVATPHDHAMFKGWTSPPCMGQPATCTFTPFAPTTAKAEFKDQPGGD